MTQVNTASLCLFISLLSISRTMGDEATKPFIVHEWGTFTSVQGSNGISQNGMHSGDESLPRFVHCPNGRGRVSYSDCILVGRDGPHDPRQANQRLETPVLYFYSDIERQISVEVGFPNGLLTEWFPAASQYSPKPSELSQVANGAATWNVKLLTERREGPEVDPNGIWAPSRRVSANDLIVTEEGLDEVERFIFYRGIGQFEMPIHVYSPEGNELVISHGNSNLNYDHLPVPSLFLLNSESDHSFLLKLSALGSGAETQIDISNSPLIERVSKERMIELARIQIHQALVESGLYADEAQAMIDTWTESYFHTPGLRLLYVLPQEWSNGLLPISISPAPTELVRTMVGRIEIMTAAEEDRILKDLTLVANGGSWDLINYLGRFRQPKLRRMRELARTQTVQEYIEILLD